MAVTTVTCDFMDECGNVCGKQLKNKNSLRQHKTIHFPRTLTCTYCKKMFGRADNLLKHTKAVHFNVDLYKCRSCDMEFKAFHTRKKHEKLHAQNLVDGENDDDSGDSEK